MATNALAPSVKNAMVRERDPLQRLLRESEQFPQYGELMNYLSARQMAPEIKPKYMDGGEFVHSSPDLPKAGVINVGYESGPSTLVHELTHAADYEIERQYHNLLKKKTLTPLEAQFKHAHEQLVKNPAFRPGLPKRWPRSEFASRLDPSWAKAQGSYRATERELPAWAMGVSVDPTRTTEYNAPLHLNPTLATEFSILLDLANRLQKSQPVTDKK